VAFRIFLSTNRVPPPRKTRRFAVRPRATRSTTAMSDELEDLQRTTSKPTPLATETRASSGGVASYLSANVLDATLPALSVQLPARTPAATSGPR
jgi:hypothetical protein